MSLSDQLWCPTRLQVTALQARGLKIKGKAGTNDAYAVMQVGKEKYQTTVAEKSVAPVWKEEATFDLPQPLQPPGGGAGGSERSTLRVHVLHRALVGPDKLLGQAVIDLLQLSLDKTRSKSEWFKLLDKTGKADKDRGEVLVDIQFLRNNMTASMFDLSAAGKSKSRLGKFKDKVRGKKKDSDATPTAMPSFPQVLTDSEDEEGNGDGAVAAGKDEEKKKKKKIKILFSPKTNLQRNMSQSMSVLPAKNSLSGSQSSGLNVDPSEGKKKFKFMIHKRSGSSGTKDSSSAQQKAAEQSNLCINGSHVYNEEPQSRNLRIGSSFSLASSGHGSMEDVPESSPPSVDSIRTTRQYSPWTEEEEEISESVKEDDEDENGMEEEKEVRVEGEEGMRVEEEKRRLEEERRVEEEERKQHEERARREEEMRVEAERRRVEEEERARKEEEMRQERERRRIMEEEEIARKEEEMRMEIERRREEEEERARKEEEMRMEIERKRRMEEEERARMEEEMWMEMERRRVEEEERARKEEEMRMEIERTRVEEEERVRKEEEMRQEIEIRRIEEERARKKEEMRMEIEKKRVEEERARKEEEVRLEMERRRVEEEEKRYEEEARKEEERRKQEEKRRIEEERLRNEKEEMLERQEQEKMMQMAEQKRQEEERMIKRMKEQEEEERKKIMEERRMEDEKIRKEEEERARKEREEHERLLAVSKEEVEKKMENIQSEEPMKIVKADVVASLNPFDEAFPSSPSSPAGSWSSDPPRARPAGSLPRTRTSSSDDGDQGGAQREKRPAPQPPGRHQAGPPHPERRGADAKVPQKTSTHTSSLSLTVNEAKRGKGPAPSRPSPGAQTSPAGDAPKTCGSEVKRGPAAYSLNPFDDDEDDEPFAQDEAHSGHRQWPPAAGSQAKVKSSKRARAPPLPEVPDASSTAAPAAAVPDDHGAHPREPRSTSEDKPAAPQTPGGKKEEPLPTKRRLLPVKPLNSLRQSGNQGGKDIKTIEILTDELKNTKVDPELKGPYSQLTKAELISLVLKQEKQLLEKDKKISELEQYIDNLLVRVMEEQPSILMSMKSLKKSV